VLYLIYNLAPTHISSRRLVPDEAQRLYSQQKIKTFIAAITTRLMIPPCSFRRQVLDGVWLWVVEVEVEVEVVPVVLLVAELRTDTVAVGEAAVVLVVEELWAGTVTTVAGEVAVVFVVEGLRIGDETYAGLFVQ
jgi:hypothetical protein